MAHPGLPGVMFQPTVLVLAAGQGERFRAAGGHTDKLQSLLTTARGTRTVLEHVVAAVQASGLPWHVVTAQETRHHAVQGMGTSIATGVAATRHAPGWLILPADLPLVRPESLRAVAQALAQHVTVAPTVQGQRGHPVGLQALCRDELLALRGDQGARVVLQRHAPHLLALEDVGCVLDVDTPDLLAQAQRLAGPFAP